MEPDAVAARLRDEAERDAALSELEALRGQHERPLALAVAPALAELLASGIEAPLFRRAGLLLGRLVHEAQDSPGAIYGAAFGEGRLRAVWASEQSVVAQGFSRRVGEFSRDDALNYSCMHAHEPSSWVRGCTAPWRAAVGSSAAWLELMLAAEPIVRSSTTDAHAIHVVTLLLGLLRAADTEELPEMAIGGAFFGIFNCCQRPAVARAALERGVFEIAAAQLRAIGSPAEWLPISGGNGGRAIGCFCVCATLMKAFGGEAARPDAEAFAACGMFEACVSTIQHYEARGAENVPDTNGYLLGTALTAIQRSGLDFPGCREALRGAASALAFCMEHDIDCVQEIGSTCGSVAAQLAAIVFGRDESGSPFVFTQAQVDTSIECWSHVMRAEGWRAKTKPTPESIHALELCISDVNSAPIILS